MKGQLNVLTIIPARGGSKGIPRKNLRVVGGVPLVAHSIQHALGAALVTRVAVSTDDAEIAEMSIKCGAEVINRPAEISGDKDASELALLHVLDTLKQNEGYIPDLVVFLQATSPVRSSKQIDASILKLLDQDADSGFTAYPQHFTGRWKIDSDGCASPINFDLSNRPMRQDYPVRYLENGNFYIFRPSVLRRTGNRLGGKIIVFEMGAIESLQIDTPADIQTLELVLGADQKRVAYTTRMLSSIKLLVFDFDGVMTDNRVFVNHKGEEFVACNRSDGYGLSRVRGKGIKMMVLSTEKNNVVAARCDKLNIECQHGVADKIVRLQEIASDLGLHRNQIGFVGNDINDLECMEWVGVAIAPSDAHPKIKSLANIITPQRGGYGVVRQVTDWLLDAD